MMSVVIRVLFEGVLVVVSRDKNSHTLTTETKIRIFFVSRNRFVFKKKNPSVSRDWEDLVPFIDTYEWVGTCPQAGRAGLRR